jgi:hypothetical protein
MAWTAPFTAVSGSVFQAAQFNASIRDNLLETAPAKATTPGSIFAVTDTNRIAERTPGAATDNTEATITSTTFADPAAGNPGPWVTINTGVMALVGFRATLNIPSATARVECSYEVSGATTRAAINTRSIGYSASGNAANSGMFLRGSTVDLCTGLTPGMNTFRLMYNVSSGTGVADSRRIWVLPL